MTDLLPSWTDGAARAAITAFVDRVTSEGDPAFVPPAERVAVFDNDGTLWCEKPMPIQLDFTLHRFAEMAAADPALRDVQPWKACYERDFAWLGGAMIKHYHGDDSDVMLLMGAIPKAFAAMTVDAYAAEIRAYFDDGRPPDPQAAVPVAAATSRWSSCSATSRRTGSPPTSPRAATATSCASSPRTCTGSRPSGSSAARSRSTTRRPRTAIDVLYKSEMDFFDDGPTKPIRIWSRIGRRPLVAGGQLERRHADAPVRPERLADGPARCSSSTTTRSASSTTPTGAEDALARARDHGWTVVSIRDDWRRVFADAPA